MPGVMEAKDAAARLGMSVVTFRRHRVGDRIVFGEQSMRIIRVGRIIKVPVAELERLLGERAQVAS